MIPQIPRNECVLHNFHYALRGLQVCGDRSLAQLLILCVKATH